MFETIDVQNIENSPISPKNLDKINEIVKYSTCTVSIGPNKGLGFLCNIPNQIGIKAMLIASTDILNEKFLKKNNDIVLSFDNINNNKNSEIIIIKLNIKREILYLSDINITLIELKPGKDRICKKYFIDLDGNTNNTDSDLCIIYYDSKIKSIAISFNLSSYINNKQKYKKKNSNCALILSSRNSKIVGLGKDKTILYFFRV